MWTAQLSVDEDAPEFIETVIECGAESYADVVISSMKGGKDQSYFGMFINTLLMLTGNDFFVCANCRFLSVVYSSWRYSIPTRACLKPVM